MPQNVGKKTAKETVWNEKRSLNECLVYARIFKYWTVNFIHDVGKILKFHSEKARKKKAGIDLSPPDTANECQHLTKEYDAIISGAIDNFQPISIETFLEIPLCIAHHLIENKIIDENSRR